MIEQGDSEIDAILSDVFPLAGAKHQDGKGRVHLPGVRVPSGGTAGGGGEAGARAGSGSGAPAEAVETPILLHGQPIEALRKLYSKTQLHVQQPPHQACIVPAEPIDVFPTAAVAIAGGGYGAGSFNTVVNYTVPEGFSAVINFAGQQAESAAAYQDMQWGIRVDAKGFVNYGNMRSQLFQLAPPGTLIYIPLRGGQTIDIQAASLSARSYNVWARLMGWQWPTRYTEGESALGNTVG